MKKFIIKNVLIISIIMAFAMFTTYKIYYNNLVSCLKGMSEENSKQVMEGVEDILNSRLDPEMVEICRYIKMAYVRMYEDETTI